MNAPTHFAIALAACVVLAGCVAPGTRSMAGATARLDSTRSVSARDLAAAITPGMSTRSDVIAALGKTTVIGFDSGFEVWVYRYAGDLPARPGTQARGDAEFVVLFAPTGIVAKTRIRPAPAADEAGEMQKSSPDR